MSRQPYRGSSRKLLVAIDVGTTFSGVSYSILDPNIVPVIRTVTRFPAQVQVGGDSKIPTVLYYNRDGKVQCAGAETASDGIQGRAEDEDWVKAEWFKLHLRPRGMLANIFRPYLPPLPMDIPVEQVFADFLEYLFDCTRTYIKETHANGPMLWQSVEDNTVFVLTHPNGWGGQQQAKMRKAAVMAGLVPDDEAAQSRISFVTEGEASLHFCINNGLSTAPLEKGEGIIIVDAGGGTLDISAYKGSDKVYTEIASPQCHFEGSTFVTARARKHIEGLLKGSKFSEDVPYIAERFDKRAKHSFKNEKDVQFIQFASVRQSAPALNIRHGQLKLLGPTVAGFFEPAISCIEKAIEEQVESSHHPISSIFLVGGFAASDYLYAQVKGRLANKGLSAHRPDSHVNKAVSEGAASYYLDHFVTTRVSRLWYGLTCSTRLDLSDPKHMARAQQGTNLHVNPLDGISRLSGYFDVILPKNEQVLETREYRQPYSRTYEAGSSWSKIISTKISYYQDQVQAPTWVDEVSETLKTLCTIEADMSKVNVAIQHSSITGRDFFRLEYDIVLMFGLTELRAQFAWKENGVEKRGPANIVYH